MIRRVIQSIIFFQLIFFTGLQAQNSTFMDSVSYSLGVLVAKSIQSQGFSEIQTDTFAKAVEDVLKGNALKIDPNEANAIIQQYAQKESEKQFAPVIEKGEQFLAENAKREEVKTTATGLQYEVLTKGEGGIPADTSQVEVHYEGTLLDGTVFDSSYKRGEPVTFGVTQVIPGWTEALKLMPVGSKWKIYLPYELAYGARGTGQGGPIGPYETLIFTVELLGIK
jgi:FKBP-type peptidyl-prolyl cis-trans isomerase FklB